MDAAVYTLKAADTRWSGSSSTRAVGGDGPAAPPRTRGMTQCGMYPGKAHSSPGRGSTGRKPCCPCAAGPSCVFNRRWPPRPLDEAPAASPVATKRTRLHSTSRPWSWRALNALGPLEFSQPEIRCATSTEASSASSLPAPPAVPRCTSAACRVGSTSAHQREPPPLDALKDCSSECHPPTLDTWTPATSSRRS